MQFNAPTQYLLCDGKIIAIYCFQFLHNINNGGWWQYAAGLPNCCLFRTLQQCWEIIWAGGGHECTICTCVVTSSFHAADFEACLKAFQEASVLFSRHPSHSVTLTPATAQSAVPSIVNREYNNDYQSLLSLSHNIYILMLIILCRLILHPFQQYIHVHKTRVFTI